MRFNFRYPLNVPGKYYTDDRCFDCDFCLVIAPSNFKRDEKTGFYYIYHQPQNNEDHAKLREALLACPVEAIHDDGDAYDWQEEPILDWNKYFQARDVNANYRLPENTLAYEDFTVDGKYNCDYGRE